MKKVELESLVLNWVKSIHHDWAVITVQDKGKVNGMTINWAQMGWLWNKHVVSLYVRPQRHTYPLINEEDTFSLAFFDESFRKELAYLGRVSGRDEDKLQVCNFTTSLLDETPVIDQAKMVFTLKKLHVSDLKEDDFTTTAITDSAYPEKDYHRVIVAEIVSCYIEE